MNLKHTGAPGSHESSLQPDTLPSNCVLLADIKLKQNVDPGSHQTFM